MNIRKRINELKATIKLMQIELASLEEQANKAGYSKEPILRKPSAWDMSDAEKKLLSDFCKISPTLRHPL